MKADDIVDIALRAISFEDFQQMLEIRCMEEFELRKFKLAIEAQKANIEADHHEMFRKAPALPDDR